MAELTHSCCAMATGLRALVLALLAMGSDAARAQSDWVPEPAGSKRSLAAHLQGLRELPPGSVSQLSRQSSKSNGDWRLRLPNGGEVVVTGTQRLPHSSGDVTYSGFVAGAGAAFPVLVTEGAEASFGEWHTPHGRYWFESWGDDGWLIALDHPQLQVESPDHGVAALPASRTSRAADKPAHASAAHSKDGETVIDVLFLHTAGFAQRYPGSAATTRINFLVALANQTFSNTDVGVLLRVVGIDPVAYGDDNDNGEALEDLQAAVDPAGSAVPSLAQLRSRRSQTGADLVSLLRPHDIEVRGSCGIAYLFGEGSAFGVNVTSDGFSSWSLCSNETYTHEVGHNLGAEHQAGATSPDAGFGKAHVVLNQLHTVMASFGTGNPNRGLRLLRFSNPRQLCGGQTCGAADASDNARRIGDNMAAVAGYMPASAGQPLPVRPPAQDPDEDGDGVPESSDAFPHDPLHSSDRDLDRVPDGLDAFPDNPAESRDTDGDGIGDIADPDRDGDGIANAADALPLNPAESVDSDADGVGNNADAFDSSRTEWADLDGDGIGDNADPDTDGDGLADFGSGQDLLVASIGNDRVLRLDGDSGRLIAVEIAESHSPVALGSKSTLAWNAYRRRVEALIASEVRRYEPATRQRESRVLRSFRGGGAPGLATGLSAGLALAPDGRVFIADGSLSSLHRYDAVTAAEQVGGVFSDMPFFAAAPRALAFRAPSSVWTLDRLGQLREVSTGRGDLLRQVNLSGAQAPIEPEAMSFGPDGALYIADTGGNRVLRVDVANGNALSTRVAAGAGGLQQPSGLAFDSQGRLYVSSAGDHRVLRYDGATGAFLDEFSQLPAGRLLAPRSLLFVPQVADRYPRDAQARYRPRAGAWFNPQRSGQGIDLQAIPGGLALAWYTYDEAGRPTWYLAVGALANDAFNAPLQRYTWDGSRASGVDVGSVTLSFSAEDRATFGWQLGERSGSEAIEHLQTGRSIETQFPTAVWYAPTSSGWGYSITRQGEILAIAAFFFDRQGEPTWALGVGPSTASTLDMQRLFAPGACPGCAGNTSPVFNDIGSLQFEVIDELSAEGRIELLDAEVEWRFENLDLLRLSESPTRLDGSPLP